MSQQSYGSLLERLDGLGICVLVFEVHLTRILLVPLREHGTAVEQDKKSQIHGEPDIVRPLLKEVIQQFPDAVAEGPQESAVEDAFQLTTHDRRGWDMSAPRRRWVTYHLRYTQRVFTNDCFRERCQAARNPKAESVYNQLCCLLFLVLGAVS